MSVCTIALVAASLRRFVAAESEVDAQNAINDFSDVYPLVTIGDTRRAATADLDVIAHFSVYVDPALAGVYYSNPKVTRKSISVMSLLAAAELRRRSGSGPLHAVYHR
jgi:hypothetical protein